MRPPGVYFRATPTDYFDGEDHGAPDAPPYQASGLPSAPALTPFSSRLRHLDDLPREPWASPKQKFRAAGKGLSYALGAQRNTRAGLGGHSCDVELGRLEPGQRGCPYHSHAGQWELFLFLEGTATFRTPAGNTVVGPDDVLFCPPGEAHEFTNTGLDDVSYLLIADNPAVDYWHYPDSNK